MVNIKKYAYFFSANTQYPTGLSSYLDMMWNCGQFQLKIFLFGDDFKKN